MTTLIEKLLSESKEGRRELARQSLLVSASDQIWEILEESGISSAELAKRLGTSASNVSQMLSGRRNMTLSTLADVAFEIGCIARVTIRKNGVGATVLPSKWKLINREARSFSAERGSEGVEKFEYETASVSLLTSANDTEAYADQPAAA